MMIFLSKIWKWLFDSGVVGMVIVLVWMFLIYLSAMRESY